MRAWAGLCPTAHGEGAEVAHPAIRTTCMNIPFRPVRAMLQRQRSGKDGYQPIRSSSPERLPRLGRHVSPGPEHTKRPPQQGSIPSRPLDRTQRVNQPTVNRTIAPGQACPGRPGPAARAALRPRCAAAAFVPLVARVTRASAERGLARRASQPRTPAAAAPVARAAPAGATHTCAAPDARLCGLPQPAPGTRSKEKFISLPEELAEPTEQLERALSASTDAPPTLFEARARPAPRRPPPGALSLAPSPRSPHCGGGGAAARATERAPVARAPCL